MLPILALTGCSWLFNVPENDHPERSSAEPVNRVTNQIRRDADYASPEARSKTTSDLSTRSELAPDRRDLRRVAPKTVDQANRKPFQFKTASGTRIITPTRVDGGPSVEDELGITAEELESAAVDVGVSAAELKRMLSENVMEGQARE